MMVVVMMVMMLMQLPEDDGWMKISLEKNYGAQSS